MSGESLQPLTFADVTNRARYQRPSFGPQRSDGYFRRELGSVLASPAQIQVSSNPALVRIRCVARSLICMTSTRVPGHQHLDALPEQLDALVAEELLGLSIDEHDRALLVDYDHRVGCGLQEALDAIQRVLAIRNVTDHHQPSRHTAVRLRARAQLHAIPPRVIERLHLDRARLATERRTTKRLPSRPSLGRQDFRKRPPFRRVGVEPDVARRLPGHQNTSQVRVEHQNCGVGQVLQCRERRARILLSGSVISSRSH